MPVAAAPQSVVMMRMGLPIANQASLVFWLRDSLIQKIWSAALDGVLVFLIHDA
jgi:hypothetical protein